MNKQAKVGLAGIIVALVVVGFLVWYIYAHPRPAAGNLTGDVSTQPTTAGPAATSPASLGEELYNKTANPLEGKLPAATPAPSVPNPLRGVYKNPFE